MLAIDRVADGEPEMIALGGTTSIDGFVTRLNALGPTGPAFAEDMLGFREGRLAAGYWIGLLAEPLRPNQVEFGGGTQFSDGRLGTPLADADADKARMPVHEDWREKHGAQTLQRMCEAFARDRDNLFGERRIIKLRAAARALSNNPAIEYPPGRQAPQYKLTEPHSFFIAAEVDPQMIAHTAAGWSVPLGPNVPARTRKLLYDYLKQVRTAT